MDTASDGGRLPTRDEAVARLEAFQERLERALAQGPAAYDLAFDGAPAGIGLHEIDLARTITRVSPSELALLGYTAAQVLGQPAWKFVLLQETSQRSVEKKLAGGGLKPYVRSFVRADGRPLTAAVVERYRRDASGAVTGIRTALTPIRLEDEGERTP